MGGIADETVDTGRGVVLAAVASVGAMAQTVKVGIINTYSGPFASVGEQLDRGIRLYMKQHEKDLPAGVKIELIRRDDTGPNPEVAKRLAQELITRDHVQLLAGTVFTPNALSVAPLATEAKVPFIIMNAGTSMITTKSPYIARVSFTLWQSSYPLADGRRRTGSRKFIRWCRITVPASMPSKPSPRASPTAAARWSARCGCRWPTRISCRSCNGPRMPSRTQCSRSCRPAKATALMKAFGDLGLKQAGIKLIGTGDITTDEELPEHGRCRAGRGDGVPLFCGG